MTLLYQPYFKVTGAASWIPFASPVPSVSVAVTGLSAATSYDFEVTATNSFGSATSTSVTALTATAGGGAPPGSVIGSQTSGAADPVVTGPASGTAVQSTTLPITGITITDAVSSVVTAWNPADMTSIPASNIGYTLSSGNLRATAASPDATGGEGVRSTTSKTAGKLMFEMTIAGVLDVNMSLGITAASYPLNTGAGLGSTADSFGWYPVANPPFATAQAGYINNLIISTNSPATGGSDVTGNVITFAIDLTAKLAWVTSPAMRTRLGSQAAWNNSATASPGSGTGGMSLSTLAAGPYFVTTTGTASGAIITLNVGNTAFSVATPTGFAAWDGPSTMNLSTTAGTLSMTGGSGTNVNFITIVSSLAAVRTAATTIAFNAPAATTTANVVIAFYDRNAVRGAITVPIAVVAPTAPAPPTGLVVT